MRLFISYARIDMPYCMQIVNMLDVHEVWYDQRLYAGQQWWKEILRRLDWCEGFVYLLSPESVASDYCRQEFELAQSLNRHIFPVLIHQIEPLPDALGAFQYADLSKGLTADTVRHLLNSIYSAEHQKPLKTATRPTSVAAELGDAEFIDSGTVISRAASAMEAGQFDRAVFLFKHAKANGLHSRFINIDVLLSEAEIALERQMFMREADRDYRQIAEIIKYKATRRLGCEAFQSFREAFPDYDPEGLTDICGGQPQTANGRSFPTKPIKDTRTKLIRPKGRLQAIPLLEWCEIPAGTVQLNAQEGDENVRDHAGENTGETAQVAPFRMSKYPITNAQYQIFLEDPHGYANPDWWNYSPEGCEMRIKHPTPMPSNFKGEERPRETINWFDAIAFCQWLSAYLGETIILPTLPQRQRAAQADDGRLYPWGQDFDPARCNTRESDIKMTTVVTRYADGASPHGVYDLAGNIWEWCLKAPHNAGGLLLTPNEKCIMQGGSFNSPNLRAQSQFVFRLDPHTIAASIGFRVVCL